MTRKGVLILLVLAMGAIACNSRPKGRIKEGEEGDLVGARTAGSATYNRLIADATRKLLESVAAKLPDTGMRQIAFVGVENRGAEDLGDIREATNQQIETVIFQAKRFDLVSQRYVNHAFMTAGLRPEDLFLASGRDEFVGILREQGQDPDYLLWAIYTTLSTGGEHERQRDYLLSLEMVDAETGRLVEKETAKVRKAYR